MGVRDFLERLRPSGTPGAASLSGVPADDVAERSAELEAVLAQLAGVESDVARIKQEAAVEGKRRREAAAEQARAIIAKAGHDARAEQHAAAASARSRAREDTAARMAAAHQEATAIAERARARTPELLVRVIAEARAELASIRVGAP
ncbi:MAG: hypothetical protein R2720_01775 [Candidatus Nanopelagicales bacterium]